MKIITNNHERQFKYRNEVPDEILSSEFDYQNEDDFDGFFQYRDEWYHLDQFMRTENSAFQEWHGSLNDTFFSGILIRVADDGETYQVATFYA